MEDLKREKKVQTQREFVLRNKKIWNEGTHSNDLQKPKDIVEMGMKDKVPTRSENVCKKALGVEMFKRRARKLGTLYRSPEQRWGGPRR